MTETQHRFLLEIAQRVAAADVVEVRLFPSLRQGRVESGVAVLAVAAPALISDPGPEAGSQPDLVGSSEAPGADVLADGAQSADVVVLGEPPDRAASTEERVATPAAVAVRFSILTAHYRLTLKGPDRGKWEFSLVHDADAPLDALEQVVRGVARRVGDAGDPELLSGAAFQRAVSEPWWNTAT